MSENELFVCACAVRDDDPGMIVCWRCEQPVARLDAEDSEQVLAANVIGVLLSYRKALERISDYGREYAHRTQHLKAIALIADEALDAVLCGVGSQEERAK